MEQIHCSRVTQLCTWHWDYSFLVSSWDVNIVEICMVKILVLIIQMHKCTSSSTGFNFKFGWMINLVNVSVILYGFLDCFLWVLLQIFLLVWVKRIFLLSGQNLSFTLWRRDVLQKGVKESCWTQSTGIQPLAKSKAGAHRIVLQLQSGLCNCLHVTRRCYNFFPICILFADEIVLYALLFLIRLR